MKKNLFAIVIIALLISFCACGSEEKQTVKKQPEKDVKKEIKKEDPKKKSSTENNTGKESPTKETEKNSENKQNTGDTGETGEGTGDSGDTGETDNTGSGENETTTDSSKDTGVKDTEAAAENSDDTGEDEYEYEEIEILENLMKIESTGDTVKFEKLQTCARAAFPVISKNKYYLAEVGSPDEEEAAAYRFIIDGNDRGSDAATEFGVSKGNFAIEISIKIIDIRTEKLVCGPVSKTVLYKAMNEDNVLQATIDELLYILFKKFKK
ncbi:MAG: hypothetical protein GY757_38070 [bacterium]|nr:hypothetical protein [bacterium]